MTSLTPSTTPLALYIHIPWCEKKCPYCDFNSHLMRKDIDDMAYVRLLLEDLSTDLARHATYINSRPLNSIFIGGGTPSLFSPESFSALIKGVESQIGFAENIEITSEANPGSAETAKFTGFKDAGINRLSIGIQSFNQNHLKALGRVHNSEQALIAAECAKRAGFDNFNLDLMFGLPDQNTEQALQDLETAISLNPTHLSCYQLTIEPNTLFHHNPPITPEDDILWEMQSALQERLSRAGYQQYEVSAYAQQGKQCQHNLNYWQFGDYLGIGAGAHGKLSDTNGNILRSWKVKHPNTYMNANTDSKRGFLGGEERVDASQQPFEFMMNALRLKDGVNLDLFKLRTGLEITALDDITQHHQSLGLINIDNNHLQPTERGRQMLDSMLQDYLA